MNGVRPLFASSSECAKLFGLTRYDLKALRESGAVHAVKLTQKKWTKTVKAKLPASLGACLKAQLKDGVDVNTIGNKTSSYGYVCRSYLVNASDNEVGNSDAEGVRLLFDENVLSSLLDQENGIIMSFPKDFKTGD